MSIFSRLFGSAPAVDYKQLMHDGAVILDVRSPQEYQGGHVAGSLNMPLQGLNATAMARLKKDKPVITCCASGARSASARSILLSNGFTQVYNAGPWSSLQNKLG
jgi:phage shock protein E